MTNAELARHLTEEADDLMRRRKILLAASAALSTTNSTGRAIHVLKAITVPEIRDGAIELITALERT